MKIKLYHQHTCGMCKAVAMMLNQSKIDYEECHDIEEMKANGITCTPTLIVDGVKYEARAALDWAKSHRA